MGGFEVIFIVGCIFIVLGLLGLSLDEAFVFLFAIGFVLFIIGICGFEVQERDREHRQQLNVEHFVHDQGYSVADAHKVRHHDDEWTVDATDSHGTSVVLHVVQIDGKLYIVVNAPNAK